MIEFLLDGKDIQEVLRDPRSLQELQPYMPIIVNEVVPELSQKLVGRAVARTIRELYE